ncbi:MarR family winged helix-turn-helix transcriptional regulator [Rhodococcus sp. IEGM 1379]|uniref:MarR family winged helix-turn-helix transcriptional regulator n=1 Tax=Rhodococcus sp. IEGM 1379 TaxID=3047086 RepID=UPI0024B825A4|nr:MarR family winged helix-turn-helix transcriptional regulator [Rhodococcus sp. IEGM 1379]MDI9918776.1 MarR family winged helix-turn-helix transcriptional regulator [Rhodococcus sp. IEGM 1379]
MAALVKEGYLVSEPDPHDGRVALFSPTPDAAAKFGDVSKARRDGITDMLAGWTQEDVSTFVTLLERFAQSA